MISKEIKEYILTRIQVLETKYTHDKNDEYMNAKLLGGVRELKTILEMISIFERIED